MILCNAVRNLTNLIISSIFNNIENKKNEKEKLMSETDTILYQQVRSSIPFNSDTEDSDYEEEINDIDFSEGTKMYNY